MLPSLTRGSHFVGKRQLYQAEINKLTGRSLPDSNDKLKGG
jgi:hypothetical protein